MFLHRMALELHMTVEELGTRMSASELMDWVEYWNQVSGHEEAVTDLVDITDVRQLEAIFG